MCAVCPALVLSLLHFLEVSFAFLLLKQSEQPMFLLLIFLCFIHFIYVFKKRRTSCCLSVFGSVVKNPLIKVQINELESLTCVKGQTCLPHPSPTYFTICPEISGTVANNCPFKLARSSSSSMPIFCCLVQIAEQRRLVAVSAEPQRVPLLSSHFPRSPLATLIFVDIRQLTSWSRWRTRPPRGTQ